MKKIITRTMAVMMALLMVVSMSVSVFAAGVSTEKEALNKALSNAGLKKTEVKLIDVEKGKTRYDVEFTRKSNGAEYDYEISIATGKILEKSIDYSYKHNSSKSKVGKLAAQKRAAKAAGVSLSVVKQGTCKYEYDDKEGTYEVKFTTASKRYDIEILAPTGKLIEYSWERINKK